jgi:hypothetical protein
MNDKGKRPTAEMEVVDVTPDAPPSVLVFSIDGVGEVLSVTPEGFFVRGRPVDVGDVGKHDREVYGAFKEFLGAVVPRPISVKVPPVPCECAELTGEARVDCPRCGGEGIRPSLYSPTATF